METICELPHWLLDISAFYGGRRMFKLEVPFWLKAYPDLIELIERSQRYGEIIATPTAGDIYYNNGVPQTFNVEILANTWRRLREANRPHGRRQISRDGHKLHVETGYNHEIYNANLADVADEARHHLTRLSTELDIRVRRAHEMRLLRIKLIRGDELREQYPQMYADIQVTLGMKEKAD